MLYASLPKSCLSWRSAYIYMLIYIYIYIYICIYIYIYKHVHAGFTTAGWLGPVNLCSASVIFQAVERPAQRWAIPQKPRYMRLYGGLA